MDFEGAAERAGEIARGWVQEQGPGGCILLFDEDRPRAQASGGFAHLELGIPCSADTVFRYASISKHFLCSLVIHGGAIRLDDRLGDHLHLCAPVGDVSVGRALDMTGGLPDLMEAQWQLGVAPSTTLGRDELLRFASSLDALNFVPGTEISYSNTGYRLLQAVLEAKGHAYGDLLRRAFLEPLGLGLGFPSDDTQPVRNLAAGYWLSPDGWREGRHGAYFSASGGLTGTALDLMTWVQALLADRGPAAGLLEGLCAPRCLLEGQPTRYGLGLARYEIAGEAVLGHGGSLSGYKNHFLVSPSRRAGVVVLSNREDTEAQRIALALMATLLGASMPAATARDLPTGRFIAESEPLWLEHQPGSVTFLGAQQSIFRVAPGVASNHSAELPIRLEAVGDHLLAEIGHVRRRFRRAAEQARLDPEWEGRWSCRAQNAEFEIVLAEGSARLLSGAGPSHLAFDLIAIAPDLALLERNDGPWRQRLCLHIVGDEIRLLTNRCRVLRFRRA